MGDARKNFLAWAKRHLLLVGLLGGPIGALLFSNFIDWLTGDFLSRKVWGPVRDFLVALAARPTGAVALTILLWTGLGVLLLVALALLDRTPMAGWQARPGAEPLGQS